MECGTELLTLGTTGRSSLAYREEIGEPQPTIGASDVRILRWLSGIAQMHGDLMVCAPP
jgi:hypothetical protein